MVLVNVQNSMELQVDLVVVLLKAEIQQVLVIHPLLVHLKVFLVELV